MVAFSIFGLHMAQAKTKHTQTIKPSSFQPKLWQWLAGILVLTLICYLPLFSGQKEFTNWDDDGYVTAQPLITSLSSENIKANFKPSTGVMLNWHPLTMLSLAIDYQRGYDEETNTLSITPFATTNLILHLLNTVLVFFFLYLLSRKKLWVGLIGALLFGIHPMHVESVAWISERKDVLYCFFFLLSCLAYLRYLETNKMQWLIACFVAFVASCLSKAMAVPLPFVLLLTDYLHRRKITAKVVIEKVPFFLLALWIGYNAVGIQSKAIGGFEHFSALQRLLFASYGFLMYWVKLLLPVHLSALYPYPVANATESLPVLFYISPLIALAIIIVPFVLLKKRGQEREAVWGIGTYAAMIALVLQFVAVGQAIMADRYTYVSYIGPFFIIGIFLNDLLENPRRKKIALGITAVYTLMCIAFSYQRVQVWDNSKLLWADVIEKYPYETDANGKVKPGVKTAYKNLGEWYATRQMWDSAAIYYKVLEQAGTTDPQVWSNIGNIYAAQNDITKALNAYNKALLYDSVNYETYLKRGLMFARQGNNEQAIHDMDKVTALEPNFEQAYITRIKSMLKTEHYEDAIKASDAAIQRFPRNAEFCFYKGAAFIAMEKYTDAIQPIDRAIKLNPGNAMYYYNAASAYSKTGNKAHALQYAQQAQKMGFPISKEFMDKLTQ